jgi:hypothetical protein
VVSWVEGSYHTIIKIYWNFDIFADLESLEFEVPTICLVTGCVSLGRDRRYQVPALRNRGLFLAPNIPLFGKVSTCTG